MQQQLALRVLLGMAAVVIIIAGLKTAAPVLVPLLLAGFISILCAPILIWLTQRRVPRWVAVTAIVLFLLGLFTLGSSMLTASTQELRANLPDYRESFDQLTSEFLAQLRRVGLPVDGGILSYLEPSSVLSWMGTLFSGLRSVLVNFFIVMFLVAFALLEVDSFRAKLDKAFGAGGPPEYFSLFSLNIKKYLFIKSWISLATGVLVGLLCWLIGLEFALLWGLLAFFLNFVPSIGSLLASIPAIVLAIATGGWWLALQTTVVFLLVNTLIGNIIEPRVMGSNMDLSPLVVFSSLIIWGWIFGPVGFLLAVPLTMVLHIVFDSHPDTRWFAVLLGR